MKEEESSLSHRIGGRLRGARNALGLSLSQLSERTGGQLTKSRISNYEQGIRRMGTEEALALADALGSVSAAHLLCVDDDHVLSPDERRLLERYRSLTIEAKASLRQLASLLPVG